VATGGVAGGRKTCGNVIGNRAAERLRALPRREVAAIAGGIRRSQRVVAIDVARRTRSLGGVGVRARQGPARGAVIKLPVGPQNRVMASGTLCRREAGRDVIWYRAAERCRAVPIGLVAADTSGVGGR